MKNVYLLIITLICCVLNVDAQPDPTYTFTVNADQTTATTTWNGNWATVGGVWTRTIEEETVTNTPPPDLGTGTIIISSEATWEIASLFRFNGTIIVRSGGALVFDRKGSSSGELIMDENSSIILEEGSSISSTGNGAGNDGNIHNYLEIGGVGIDGEQINSLPSPPLTIDRAYIIIVLPVDILYFTATPQKKEVNLEWASSKAWDFSHYELERSADGFTFNYLTTIDAEENTNWVVNYSYSDRKPLNGISYYRLKAVDIDGRFEYKGTEVVQFAGAAAVINVYPNPSDRGLLHVQQQEAAGANVSLKDNTGKTVYAGKMESPAKTIDTSSLQPGLYVLTVESTKGVQKKHVIIQ